MTHDIYDEAVEYLTKHPEKIEEAWNYTDARVGGILFEYTGPGCGCLTQVKTGSELFKGPTPELEEAIRADPRIPLGVDSITVESLPVFAEWRRRLDKELGRRPPDSCGG